MYKELTAEQYRAHLGLDATYTVDGTVTFGGFKDDVLQPLKEALDRVGQKYTIRQLDAHPFFKPVYEILIGGKRVWFMLHYGSAMLSEHLHLASLFGSKMNIQTGICGGLKKGAWGGDIIVPTWSYAKESSAVAYELEGEEKHYPDERLSKDIAKTLEEKHKVFRGPTITFQAMLAETWEDIENWSREGFYGVEMESATTFAVSKHFHIPASAMLIVADNLIEKETVMDDGYKTKRADRMMVLGDCLEVAIGRVISA